MDLKANCKLKKYEISDCEKVDCTDQCRKVFILKIGCVFQSDIIISYSFLMDVCSCNS